MLRIVPVCILATLALPAAAADLPTLAVVGVHQATLDPADQERVSEGLAKAIDATGRFEALTPAEVAGRLVGREAVVLEEGLTALPGEKLASGKNAYNQASWDEAIGYLTDAIDGFRSVFRGTNDADDLWDAWVYLGSCHMLKDSADPAAARAAFGAAIALSPAKPLNPALFPPDVVDTYSALQKELSAQKVSVQVVSADAVANVWFDGVAKGKTPAAVPDVIPGEHHVVARAPSGQGYTRVEVAAPESGPVLSIDVPLATPSLGEASAAPIGRSKQIGALYQSLGARADGIDYVLAAGVADSVLYMQLLNVSAGTWSKTIEIPYADDADDEAIQALPLLLNGVAADGGFTATAAAPAAIDIGANAQLAMLLTNQIEAVASKPAPEPAPNGNGGGSGGGGRDDGKKSKVGVVLGIVGGVVLASGAGVGTWLYTSQGEDPNQGVIVVQF